MAILQEPVVMRRRQLLLQKAAIDVAPGAAKSRAEHLFRRVPLPMQQLHIVQNSLGVAAIEPATADQLVKIVELLVRVRSDQLNGKPILVANKPTAADRCEVPEQ